MTYADLMYKRYNVRRPRSLVRFARAIWEALWKERTTR
jgi:hypothetical protein